MIKPNANPSEKHSPFYLANELFCNEFEKFIKNKNGKVRGCYNAWSYLIQGKINEPKQWFLEYKKSTFSSGDLLLSSKKQNLFCSAIWKTNLECVDNVNFKIRRKKSMDFIFLLFKKDVSVSKLYPNYVIASKNKSKIIPQLISSLENLFISNEIYEISYINEELKIELRTERHYFDIFNKLTELSI